MCSLCICVSVIIRPCFETYHVTDICSHLAPRILGPEVLWPGGQETRCWQADPRQPRHSSRAPLQGAPPGEFTLAPRLGCCFCCRAACSSFPFIALIMMVRTSLFVGWFTGDLLLPCSLLSLRPEATPVLFITGYSVSSDDGRVAIGWVVVR